MFGVHNSLFELIGLAPVPEGWMGTHLLNRYVRPRKVSFFSRFAHN